MTVPLDEELVLSKEREDARELVEELAVELSPEERQLLDLLLEGYKINEISLMLNSSSSSIHRNIYGMVEKMRQTYEKQNRHDTQRH